MGIRKRPEFGEPDYETILYETSEGVATITLNRPDRLNSFSRTMGDEFKHVYQRVLWDDEVSVIVLRAAGDRAFSTGADVKEGGWADHSISPFDWDDPGASLGPKQNHVWKPFICAVHGMAAAGAFYWLNEADIVICSDDAQFFDPHVNFGMVAAVEPAGLLGRIPYGEIMRMALLGNEERIGAETALRIGLVSEITTREALWPRAQELARIVAQKPRVALQGTVKAVWEARDMPPSAAAKITLYYPQMGNRVAQEGLERSSVPKSKWTLR